MTTDSQDLVIAKQLGFEFQRVAPGEDAALMGHRVSDDYVDLIHIDGFSRDCFAWRKRTSSLVVPGSALMERQITGSALNVLNEVLTWESDDCQW